MRLVAIASLVLATLTTACGGDPPTAPAAAHEFTGQVSGAISGTMTGTAHGLLLPPTQYGGEGFALVLSDGALTSVPRGLVFQHSGGAVKAGTYAVGDPTDGSAAPFSGVYFANAGAKGDSYFTTSGTLTIEAISSTRVRGRFDVRMETIDVDKPTPLTVHVTGTFDGTVSVAPASTTFAR